MRVVEPSQSYAAFDGGFAELGRAAESALGSAAVNINADVTLSR
jgi:hypothetical protein